MKAIILNDTSYDEHHGCTLVMRNLEMGLQQVGIEIVLSLSLFADWRHSSEFGKLVTECDLVIVNGEGTIHHDRPAGIALLEVVELLSKLGIPAVLINASYEENSFERCGRHLEQFSLISVRDSMSAKEMRETAGVDCRIVPDLSLSRNWVKSKLNRHGVGVTDSVFHDVSDQLIGIAQKKRDWIQLPITTLGASLLRAIVGRIRSARSNHGILSALNIWRHWRAESRLSHCRVRSHHEYLERIAKLDFLIAARYHSVCMALLTETPFVAIESNTSKISCLLHDVGLNENRIVSLDDFRSRKVWDGAPFSEEESQRIRLFRKETNEKSRSLFDDIAKLERKTGL